MKHIMTKQRLHRLLDKICELFLSKYILLSLWDASLFINATPRTGRIADKNEKRTTKQIKKGIKKGGKKKENEYS